MLTLEGAFRDISSANWDYLIEAAERELTGTAGSHIDVCILPADFQTAAGQAKLLKYHGCAAQAVANSATHRHLLIARTPQIAQYRVNGDYAVMRNHLVTTIQQRCTLMIGFSAQDTDVRDIFVDGVTPSQWDWAAQPKPFLFAEDALHAGQRTVLQVAYRGDFNPNRFAIEAEACVRAYAKPLLMALLMSVMELKIAALVNLGVPMIFNGGDRKLLEIGLRKLRSGAAIAAEPDRLLFIRALIDTLRRGLGLFHNGDTTNATYIPISSTPLQQVGAIPGPTGLRQAAVALSLLGCGAEDGSWSVSAGPVGAAPLLIDQAGRVTRVFMAANDQVASEMMRNGHIDPDANDALLLLSASPAARQTRSPDPAFGRTGKIKLREICMTSLVAGATDGPGLLDDFKRSASL
ncbi:MAG: hypothetical protein EOP21_10030 [Hyphomicrobiales bacterium]|nr:MAG: hypothetical protein EOP21_10030 [Hyphomicrobiales bacterium]